MFESKRIKNLEVREYTRYFNKESDGKFIEIIQWYPNCHYQKESEFIWDKRKEMYKHPQYNYWVDKSCFKNPESCMMIASIDFSKEEPDVCSVGLRPFNLENDEYLIFRELVFYAFKFFNRD